MMSNNQEVNMSLTKNFFLEEVAVCERRLARDADWLCPYCGAAIFCRRCVEEEANSPTCEHESIDLQHDGG
jgi:hypothetical protein